MTLDQAKPTPGKIGLVLHHAAFYDFVVRLMMLGRERAFRERLVALAGLEPGEAVLDIGCGTGSLAIAAARRVGPAGAVTCIDASPEMLARAAAKARRAGVAIRFQSAAAQALPFPDAQFDAAFATVMLHHLPREGRAQCAREMRRVLKPGGRVLVVDFGVPEKPAHGSLLSHIHRRHGHVKPEDMAGVIERAGLTVAKSGAVGLRNLNFVLANAPCPA